MKKNFTVTMEPKIFIDDDKKQFEYVETIIDCNGIAVKLSAKDSISKQLLLKMVKDKN